MNLRHFLEGILTRLAPIGVPFGCHMRDNVIIRVSILTAHTETQSDFLFRNIHMLIKRNGRLVVEFIDIVQQLRNRNLQVHYVTVRRNTSVGYPSRMNEIL